MFTDAECLALENDCQLDRATFARLRQDASKLQEVQVEAACASCAMGPLNQRRRSIRQLGGTNNLRLLPAIRLPQHPSPVFHSPAQKK